MIVAVAPAVEHYMVMVRARLIATRHIHTSPALEALKEEQEVAATGIHTSQMEVEELLNKVCCNSLLAVV